jgi:hypothetical protein
MRGKEQVVFDIESEKFRYLHREEDKLKNKVDIDVLNKRLNRVKKLNIYSNAKMITLALLIVVAFAMLSVSF